MLTGSQKIAFFLLMMSVCASSDGRHQTGQQSAGDEPLKLSTDLVTLDAQILNKRGAVVNGLSLQDFTLYEDGKKQLITHFSQDKLPLSIVLLLDVSGSVMPVVSRVHDEGIVALDQLKPSDEIALMVFGKWSEVYQDFTKDRAIIAKRIGDLRWTGPWIQEGTYIHDAVYKAAEHLASASNPGSRRVIIIITDNLNNQPVVAPHTQSEATMMLLQAGVSVFGLVVGDFERLASDYSAKGWQLADGIGNYVKQTGGVSVQIDKTDAVTKLSALIERLRTRYSFGYTSKNTRRDGKFRKITLKVSPEIEKRESGVSIVTRGGYFAPSK